MTTPLEVALFRGEPAAELIPIGMIEPWPDQPRRSIDAPRLRELADSIGKVGVLQPILVRPTHDGAMFGLVSGERRWRAAKLAGLEQIPAVVRTLTDAEALEAAVAENLQRTDVPPLDEAEAYERLHTAHGYSIDDIAERTGKSRTYVYARLKLTSLCAEAREYLRDERVTPTVALLIARIPTPSQQVEAAKWCVADHAGRPRTATEAATHIRARYMLRLADARFDPADAALVPAAGACGTCPKRTGAAPELFGDIAEADTCTDDGCYAGKTRAHDERYAAQMELAGATVIRGEAARALVSPGGVLMQSAGDYVGLDTTCPYDKHGRRVWREALFGAAPPLWSRLVLIETQHDGWLHAVRRVVAMEMLVELGMVEREAPAAPAEPRAPWPFPTPSDDDSAKAADHIGDANKMVREGGETDHIEDDLDMVEAYYQGLPPVSTLVETLAPQDDAPCGRRAYMIALARAAYDIDGAGGEAWYSAATLCGLCWSLCDLIDLSPAAQIVGLDLATDDGRPFGARDSEIRDALLADCQSLTDLQRLLWTLLLAMLAGDGWAHSRPQSAGTLEHIVRQSGLDPAGILGDLRAAPPQEREIENPETPAAAPAKKARAPRKPKVKSESAAAGAADMDDTPAAPAPVEDPAP